MASNDYDPVSMNVAGVRDLIGNKTNKVQTGAGSQEEGAASEEADVLDLPMGDEELLKLASQWEDNYKKYEAKIERRQEDNKKYYLGRQLEGTPYNVEFPIAANLLFEAEETFLPAALSKNPEPVVWAASNTELGTKLANDVKTMLQYHADVLVLRRKLSVAVRHWSIYYLGILKHGWDDELKEIRLEVRNPKNFVFDTEGYVDVYGDFCGYVGERISRSAEQLIREFPKHEAYISDLVDGKLGTQITYTEWWTDDFYFCTLRGRILDKGKNPFFNYEEAEGRPVNHFGKPKKPYTFISVFSLEEQPHDITSLIEQNIPNQNLITKRTQQIDVNLSRQNNSVAFSADNFTQQTAKQASTAFEKGNPVLVPPGRPIGEAIVRFPAEAYPEAAFKELATNKDNLRNSFGTQGITAQQPNEETTARGMILNQQRDSTRIGGGIGDVLEQVADNIFNWWVQLYHVYYDIPHYAAVLGGMKALEYVVLSNADMSERLVISVASGSMAPKDEINERNQAIQLYQMGVLDPKSLLTILNVPDVQNTIENTLLWLTNKPAYIEKVVPGLMPQQLPMPAQGGGGEPVAQNSPQPTLGGEPPNAALSNVSLPSLSTPAT